MKSVQHKVEWPRKALFDQIPMEIIVIDKNFTVIEANKQARKTYPNWKDKKCFELYKKRKKKGFINRIIPQSSLYSVSPCLSKHQQKNYLHHTCIYHILYVFYLLVVFE